MRRSDGSSRQRLDPSRIQHLGAERASEHDELVVGPGELDGGLRHRHRVLRPRQRGRPLQQRLDALELGPIQGERGQPVLRDLVGRPRAPASVGRRSVASATVNPLAG